jgi:hypothetical protein
MRAFEHLLVADEEVVEEERRGAREYSTCFWVSYSAFMIAVGALSMWALFKYVVMGA